MPVCHPVAAVVERACPQVAVCLLVEVLECHPVAVVAMQACPRVVVCPQVVEPVCRLEGDCLRVVVLGCPLQVADCPPVAGHQGRRVVQASPVQPRVLVAPCLPAALRRAASKLVGSVGDGPVAQPLAAVRVHPAPVSLVLVMPVLRAVCRVVRQVVPQVQAAQGAVVCLEVPAAPGR